ncbi:MAG: LysM peptidoglycan-binding domain-containing protein [Candidatus Obscuribacter sp.]|nr:LysM peptidoglycan-binding domain-containing protein [Candidatus Obscuribacter sp.]
MTLEANQIKTSTEAAVGSNPEKPNLQEVYNLLANNKSAQEQKQERTAFNEAIHKNFPTVDLVYQDKIPVSETEKKDALIVFDRSKSQIQARSTTDFSILDAQDMKDQITGAKLTPEQASEKLATTFDAKVESNSTPTQPDLAGKEKVAPEEVVPNQQVQPGNGKEQPAEVLPQTAKDDPSSSAKTEVDPKVSDKPAQPESNVEKSKETTYVVKPGDCLWNIAKDQLNAHGGEGKEASNASIRSYVDQIVARNKDQIKDEDLIYPDQKFILPEIPGEKKEQDKPQDKKNPEENSEKSKDKKPGEGEAQNQPKGKDKKIPPDGSTVPPGDNTIPPGDNTVPPGDNTVPPGDNTVPPGGSELPPADIYEGQRNGGENTVPPTDSQNPPVDPSTQQMSHGDMSKFYAQPGTAENPSVGINNAQIQANIISNNFENIDADQTGYVTTAEFDAFKDKLKQEKGETSDEFKAAQEARKNFSVIANTVTGENTGATDEAPSSISAEDVKQFPTVQTRFENQFAARAYAKENFDKLAAASDEEANKDQLSAKDVDSYAQKRATEGASQNELDLLIGLKESVTAADPDGTNNIKKEDLDTRLSNENVKVDNRAYGDLQKDVTGEVPAADNTVAPTDSTVPPADNALPPVMENPYEDMSKYFGLPGSPSNPTVGYYSAERQAALLRKNFAAIDTDNNRGYISASELDAFAELQKQEKGETSEEYKLAADARKNFSTIANGVTGEGAGTVPEAQSSISEEDLKQFSFVQSRYENQYAGRAYAKENFDALAAASEDPAKDQLSESDVEVYMDQRMAAGASQAELKILAGLKELMANVDTDGSNNVKKEELDARLADEFIRNDNKPYAELQKDVTAPVDDSNAQPNSAGITPESDVTLPTEPPPEVNPAPTPSPEVSPAPTPTPNTDPQTMAPPPPGSDY